MKTILTIDGHDFEVGMMLNEYAIESIKLEKGMYKPGCIDIQLSRDNIFDSIEKVKEDLLQKPVSLYVINDKGDKYCYAENYVIFSITPVIKRINTHTSTILNLKIFSPDKYLTLKKYSKAWTAKTLAGEIITEELKSQSKIVDKLYQGIKPKKLSLDAQLELHHLQGEKCEFIQPYLVQYNESFYDFMVRTANRCGEFIYYENDKLHVGLETQNKKVKNLLETAFTELSYNTFASEPNTTFGSHDYLGKGGYAKEEVYNYEGQADEYLSPIEKREGSMGWEEETGWPNLPIINSVMGALSKDTVTDMIIQGGLTLGKEVLRGHTYAKKQNDKYNAKYFKANLKAEQYATDKNSASQFSEYDAEKKHSNKNFYIAIREAENNAEANAIHVKYGATCPELSLGDVVTLDNQKYYIISNFNTLISHSGIEYTNSVEFDAILWDDKMANKAPYPFALENPIKKTEQQVAYVVDNDDPLRLGRARLLFPWQVFKKQAVPTTVKKNSKDEVSNRSKEDTNNKLANATPWVRVASPMASSGAGLNFIPNNGDEVMVGFEYGNIERPYVIGSLYSANHQFSDGTTTKHMITSPNGHSIKFNDLPNSMGFLTSMHPGVALLKTYFPNIFNDFKHVEIKQDKDGNVTDSKLVDNAPKELAGGISLQDKNRIYSIDMSTDKRSISIKSTFGNVDINAFTGITISAPNGNVTIKGKNVNIEANNTLKITSGKNISNQMYRIDGIGAFVGKKVLNTVLGETVNKFIDFGLLRTIMETFIRPINGEMTIKSLRNLKLEAGKGKAKIPTKIWTDSKDENKDNEEKARENKAENLKFKNQVLEPISALMSRITYFADIENREKFYDYATSYKQQAERFDELCKELENVNCTHFHITIQDIYNDIKQKDNFDDIKGKFGEVKTYAETNDIKVLKEQSIINDMQMLALNLFTGYKESLPDATIKNKIALTAFKSLSGVDQKKLIPEYNIDGREYTLPDVILKRKAIDAVLTQLKKDNIINFDKKATDALKKKLKGDKNAVYTSYANWAAYIKCMTKYELKKKTDTLIDFAKEYIVKPSKLEGMIDDMVLWSKNYHSGEILFSDKTGKQTMRFENGSIVTSPIEVLQEVKEFIINVN